MRKPFVDRIEELRHLNRALKYDGEESQVLVFTGIGGMGKTALRIALEEQILKPSKIPYAVLDYDGDPNLRPIEATLRAIRRQLGRQKIKTPVFDFLYARYFELSTGLKLSATNFPPELEGVVNILKGIPGFGNVTQILHGLSQLGLVAKERLQHKEWLYRIRDLEPREVLNLLPEVLAEDLEEVMLSQTLKPIKASEFRIPLLLDAYELLSDSHIDDTLHRKLLLLTPHLLRVIFTRTPLPWEHTFPKEWRGKITHFPSLDDLSQEDAMIFLRKKDITSADLQEHLYQLTGGYPLHLELCADICREIKEASNREPEIQDFEGATQAKNLTEELVHRLLRQLTDNERDLMGLAAYPRWVSEEILEVLSSVPESVPRIFKKFTGLSMFYPHAEISDAYVIRKEVRECLMLQQRKERLWKERHRKLSQFHRKRWEENQSFYHFREVLYHGFYENSEHAMKMFEEHFWKFLKKFSFGDAEGLIEAVPIDTLNEKQKRKIDNARARFLSSSTRSQQSLETAKHLYEALIASATDEESLCQYLFSFAGLLCVMGEYGRALELYQKTLAIGQKVYGEEHPDVAESYNKLCAVYTDQAKYEKALKYNQKALAIWLNVYGEDHSTIAKSYTSMGIIYEKIGEYAKALEYFQKSLGIRMNVFGEQHPDVAMCYNNIGVIYDLQSEYEKALECYQNSLAIHLKTYGDEHPHVARCYNNIGVVYWRKGDYVKALEYHQKSLAMRLKVYGDRHPDVAKSYDSIGVVYGQIGDSRKSLEYLQKCLDMRLKIYGEEHICVVRSYNNVGDIYCKTGELGKALEYHQKALAIGLKIFGDEHPDFATSYKGLGEVCYKSGEFGKALDYFQKCLAIHQKVFGEMHPNVADAYNDIANTLRGLKREDEAFEKIRQSVEIYRKFNLWQKVVEGLETPAGWLEEKGRSKEAEETRAEANKIRKDHNLA